MTSHTNPYRLAACYLAALLTIGLAGCSNPTQQTGDQMRELERGLFAYAEANDGSWPDKLDQIKDHVGGQAAFDKLMMNPVTGDNPGYEYVKPTGNFNDDNFNMQQVILYQLRDGERDESLKVGYSDGSARALEK